MLRSECVDTVSDLEAESTCGRPGTVPCLLSRADDLAFRACEIVPESECAGGSGFVRTACPAATHCIDAADGNDDGRIALPDGLFCVTRETVDIASSAEPPHTPGSPGVAVTNEKLLAQFGGADFSLNNARYTRFRSQRPGRVPDAILILVPGFEAGGTQQYGAPRLRRADRRQIELRPLDLESLLEPDHEARAIWALVSRLDLSGFLKDIRACQGVAGRPATDPAILLTLWLYASSQGVGSARELAKLCD